MAGLLDWVTEKAKQQYQQGLLNQVFNDPASIGRELGQLFNPQYMSQVKPMTQEQALDVALSAPMMLGITAFHGSPYKFDKFDLEKVGTGAGNQYYGKGIYFTENPQYAKSYAETDSLEGMFNSKTANDLSKAFNEGGLKKVNEYIKNNNLKDYANDINKFFNKTLYKVDIADETIPKMLDFDKPLYRQSNQVKELAMEYLPALKNKLKLTGENSVWNLTGSDLFGAMQRYKPKSKKTISGITGDDVSNMLMSKGILSSKYLDKSADAKNYVVFDPSIIKILEQESLLK